MVFCNKWLIGIRRLRRCMHSPAAVCPAERSWEESMAPGGPDGSMAAGRLRAHDGLPALARPPRGQPETRRRRHRPVAVLPQDNRNRSYLKL